MPARVHALLVVRPDGRVPADLHLQRTLAALSAQSRPVDSLTLVLCGADAASRAVAEAAGVDDIIAADRRTGFAAALALAGPRLDGDAVWLLAQDTAPEPDALARLAGALETAPSVAFAAPKLVRWEDGERIVSFGTSMTRLGRAVELVDGELDQGQHDATEDVLGADVRGLLVRADAWRELSGLDPALAGADEGLDLGVRARLRGGRVSLAPGALVAVAGDGAAGLPGPGIRRVYAERVAQLHRRLVYAPAAAVPLHWLSLLPLAVLRSLGHLLAKRPGSIGPEWAAAIVTMVRLMPVAAARRGIRSDRVATWAQLAPLRTDRAQMRHRLDADAPPVIGPGRGDLRFFSGGGAWVVLGALVTSVAAFTALLAWPVLGGGALAPLRATVAQLWADAAYGTRPLGWATSGPADPFSAVVAAVGSLSPFEPSRALVVLWVLALPAAALGGWFAATRVSDRDIVRALGAIGWALAPALLAALVDGRPTGVLVHLLLPWLVYTAAVAHRSWSAAGLASIVLAAVVACAPSLGPALAGLWAIAIVLVLVVRRGAGLSRVIWLVVPTIVVFAPLAWTRLRAGQLWALLADPGVPVAGGGTAPDLAGRMLLAAGFPTADPGGWASFAGPAVAVWVPLLVVPLAVLALLAPLTARILPAAVLLATALAGLATASIGVGIAVSTDGVAPVALWPGPALSLLWLGMLGAALTTLDAWRPLAPARASAAVAVMVLLLVVATPALTAQARGTSALTDGPASTLPAYVAAQGRDTARTATFVLTPTGEGVVADVVWGETSALGGQTTLRSAQTTPTAADEQTAHAAAELVGDPTGDIVDTLAAHGVAFVLVTAPGPDESATARSLRIAAETSLDQRGSLEKVGETGKGMLWRVAVDVADRTVSSADTAGTGRIAALQIGVVVIALLLAVPTRQTRAEARRRPRVVGIGGRP